MTHATFALNQAHVPTGVLRGRARSWWVAAGVLHVAVAAGIGLGAWLLEFPASVFSWALLILILLLQLAFAVRRYQVHSTYRGLAARELAFRTTVSAVVSDEPADAGAIAERLAAETKGSLETSRVLKHLDALVAEGAVQRTSVDRANPHSRYVRVRAAG